MSKSIKLSPKHGVNPTIPVCFWCRKEKNEIALLGQLKGDAEAPKNIILDYEPCDECKANRALGFSIIEVSTSNPHNLPMPISTNGTNNLYPTGRWSVISNDAAKQIFSEKYLKHNGTYVDKEAYEMLIPEDLR